MHGARKQNGGLELTQLQELTQKLNCHRATIYRTIKRLNYTPGVILTQEQQDNVIKEVLKNKRTINDLNLLEQYNAL